MLHIMFHKAVSLLGQIVCCRGEFPQTKKKLPRSWEWIIASVCDPSTPYRLLLVFFMSLLIHESHDQPWERFTVVTQSKPGSHTLHPARVTPTHSSTTLKGSSCVPGYIHSTLWNSASLCITHFAPLSWRWTSHASSAGGCRFIKIYFMTLRMPFHCWPWK